MNYINGMTALHICVQDMTDPRTLQQFIELLVSHDADLNANSYQGSVLFYSIILGNLSGACLLVKHGVDVNLREERAYFDNLSLAQRHGNLELVKLIVYAGFNCDSLLLDAKTCTSQSDDSITKFLVVVKSTPLNLGQICRIKIRRLLKNNLVSKIYRLPLPKLLQQYLALDIL